MHKNSVQYLNITADFNGQRIDNFLVTRFKKVPKTHIYRIVRKGEVRVNKKRVQPSYRLQTGDQIRVPPLKIIDTPHHPITPTQSLMAFLATRVLYEDKNLLIIDKPSGIPVHGGSGIQLGLVEVLRCMYPQFPHLELAHRLDADTSGCLILVKKRSILRELHDLLRSGKIQKIYWALTQGHWKKPDCRVTASLRKNQISRGERIVKVDKAGKPSITLFRTLKTYPQATLVEATLETGRTHQIRVHAQHVGHPIAGDEKYGNSEFNNLMRKLGLKRIFLHAYSVNFILPSLKQPISVTAPLEAALQNILVSGLKS